MIDGPNWLYKRAKERKVVASLTMLISWEVWKERNARVFLDTSSNANMIITRIMDEANARCLTGTKFLSNVILGEKANYNVIWLVLEIFF
jgi:hypothetical protein